MAKSANQKLALTFGVIYLLVGIFGVAATDNATLFGHEGGLLFGLFEVNIFANVVHTIIGLGLIIASSSVGGARQVNAVLGVILLVIGVIGFFIVDSEANILAANVATDILHVATAVLLLATAFGADRPAAKAVA